MEYLLFLVPVICIILAIRFDHKKRKLKNSGRIPDIMSNDQLSILMVVLAVVSTIAIILTL